MLTKTKKVRASSAAFIKGRTVYTDWSTGCIRNILFKSYGLKETLKTSTQDRGAANEERFEAALRAKGVDFARELTSPVESVTADVAWGGRSDFLRVRKGPDSGHVRPDDQPSDRVDGEKPQYDYVWELKSTGSKNKLRDLRAGKYTTENLAQTVAYMADFQAPAGSLIYTYYEVDKVTGEDKVKYEREFKVTLDDVGTIVVDNTPTMFFLQDQLDHRLAAAEAVDRDIVWDRPHNYDAKWGSPCHFCPFKRACDKYDNNEIDSTSGLVVEAATCLV